MIGAIVTCRPVYLAELMTRRITKRTSRRTHRPKGASSSVLPAEWSAEVRLDIEKLSHDGRGIAHRQGKIQFVEGALPGETVMAQLLSSRGKFDELKVVTIENPSADRVTPPCQHAAVCGGCSLQHLREDAQIAFKAATLREQLAHFGGMTATEEAAITWVPAIRGSAQGYRRKARLGARFIARLNQMVLGFREKNSNLITDVTQCSVLDERVSRQLPALHAVLRDLSVYDRIAQIEIACGDEEAVLILRNLSPLNASDQQALRAFGQACGLHIYLQPKGPDTVQRLWPESGVAGTTAEGAARLHFTLPDFDVRLAAHPADFMQVNAAVNRQMVAQAIDWLDLQAQDRVLDLFCGLGNFSLPLARCAAQVTAVEGDQAMVQRGRENALANGLSNVTFHTADLQADFTRAAWAGEGFDKILIDPPRSGALDVVQYITAFAPQRIVYVSCNPATLSRDARELKARGYRLARVGVLDMFVHTTHVESMALFVSNHSA